MDDDNNADQIIVTPPPFDVDEKVYCRDKGRYYEAIIRKTRYNSNTTKNSPSWSFLVHYTGWNDRWDRWIEAGGDDDDCIILKDNTENRAIIEQNRKEEEQENYATAETSTNLSGQKRSRGDGDDGTAATANRSSRKRLTTVRNNVAAAAADTTTTLVYSDYCELPFTLKTVLIDEYERLRRLVHVLPAPVPVRKVLNHFAKKKIKACGKNGETTTATMTEDVVQDFVQGLAQLFQEALPVCLLYPQERFQYESLKDSSKELVDVYGCEYLLRLFVRLPILLQTPRKEFNSSATATIIGPLLTDLLVLLQKNRQTLFPMSIAPAENANYRLPLPNEWMNWGKDKKEQQAPPPPSSPTVEMDTR